MRGTFTFLPCVHYADRPAGTIRFHTGFVKQFNGPRLYRDDHDQQHYKLYANFRASCDMYQTGKVLFIM